MARRIAGFLAATALQAVALVLAHDLVFLARYGSRYGEELVHAGHGEAWTTTVQSTLVLAGALVVIAVARLAYLANLVRGARPEPAGPGKLHARRLAGLWLRIGPRTALVGVVLLTIQENLERASIGPTVPGPAILLSPEYAGGLWIAIVVGLLVGLVAALFEWRRQVLLARLRAARAVIPRRAPSEAPRPAAVHPRRSRASILGRRSGRRAPPLPAA